MFALRRAALAALTAASLCSLAPAASWASSGEPWQDPSQPPSVRADELLSALTTEQKIDLALGNFAPLQNLGIPALSSDESYGLRNPGTTAMPSGQALAATFDRALARAYGQVVGSEARGEGFNEWLGPALTSIARRWPVASRRRRARPRPWPATQRRR